MGLKDLLPSRDDIARVVPTLPRPDMERTIRLAVTGLTRSGKTVFISSLIHNLLHADHTPSPLPKLGVIDSKRFTTARLDHNAAVHAPLFPFEENAAAICAATPRWPEPTTDISQIRVKIAFRPGSGTWTGWAGDTWGLKKVVPQNLVLNLDIVDYPGEWLLDLPLEKKIYAQWSEDVLALCRQEPRATLAKDWITYVATRNPEEQADEEFFATAAKLYTEFLERCRSEPHNLRLVQPGHFLRPGQYRGSPLLRFCPIPAATGPAPAGSIRAVMNDRFEAFKKHVVKGFLEQHFCKIDRQVVLIDVLRALGDGKAAFDDACQALNLVMDCFHFGGKSIYSWFQRTKISKVLFAATKADHIALGDQQNLLALTRAMMRQATFDVAQKDAGYRVMQIASVRATEDAILTRDGVDHYVLKGIREGDTEVTKWYPGAVPPVCPPPWGTVRFRFAGFKPRTLLTGSGGGIPNINLDEAIEYLIGEDLR